MGDPLRSLADAARAVTAAATDEAVLEIVARAAREVIGARHGVARRDSNGAPPGPRLAAALIARDGSSLGLIELWDKDGEFTPEDEAIVIQLAQMAANAIETLELLAQQPPAAWSCRRSSSSPPTPPASSRRRSSARSSTT